jgi:Tfp pilus assembly protein PilF
MSAQDGVLPKKCVNKMCRQTDVTDFSTCRYCGTRYDGKIDRYVDNPSLIERLSNNPMAVMAVGGVVASVVATLYLASVLPNSHSHSYSTGSRRGGGGLAAIPAAVCYFIADHMASKAQDTITNNSNVLTSDPTNYNALVSRGDAHYTRMEMGAALTDYDSAISVNPKDAEAYEKRAIIYDAMGNYPLAAKDRDNASNLRTAKK